MRRRNARRAQSHARDRRRVPRARYSNGREAFGLSRRHPLAALQIANRALRIADRSRDLRLATRDLRRMTRDQRLVTCDLRLEAPGLPVPRRWLRGPTRVLLWTCRRAAGGAGRND